MSARPSINILVVTKMKISVSNTIKTLETIAGNKVMTKTEANIEAHAIL